MGSCVSAHQKKMDRDEYTELVNSHPDWSLILYPNRNGETTVSLYRKSRTKRVQDRDIAHYDEWAEDEYDRMKAEAERRIKRLNARNSLDRRSSRCSMGKSSRKLSEPDPEWQRRSSSMHRSISSKLSGSLRINYPLATAVDDIHEPKLLKEPIIFANVGSGSPKYTYVRYSDH